MRALIVAAIIGIPGLAMAQQNCAERAHVVKQLAEGYGEEFVGGGMQNANRIIEVWASDEGGTWTVLVTRADGQSCVMASGTAWRTAPLKAEGTAG